MKQPNPKKISKKLTKFKDTRVDPYFWMRDKENPEVIKHLKDENAYADEVLRPVKPLEEKIYKETLARIEETDVSAPYRYKNYFYYERTEKGKSYGIFCRKKNGSEKEEILLDVNKLVEQKKLKFANIGSIKVSPSEDLMAYTLDVAGSRDYHLYILNLKNGTYLKDEIPLASGMEWSQDGKFLFYTYPDETKRDYKVFVHELGKSKNMEIFKENDDMYDVEIYRTLDHRFLIINTESSLTNEQYLVPADDPFQKPKLVEKKVKQRKYYLDINQNNVFIRTNKDAKNYSIMKTSLDKLSSKNWKVLIKEDLNQKILNHQVFDNFVVVEKQKVGARTLYVYRYDTKKIEEVDFGLGIANYSLFANYNVEEKKILISYSSWTGPESVYEYDVFTKQRSLLKKEIVHHYDESQYESKLLWVSARDKVKVPVTLIYKKGIKLENNNPLILYGYGSYGISVEPYFSHMKVSLLDRGIIFAYAYVRGGGELGENWKETGKFLKKKNSFFDFVDISKFLIKKKITSEKKLGIMGGSAGGLLVAATLNEEPELYRAALAQVPFVDVLTTMLDSSLPLTTGEYEEWGNPNEQKYYKYMKSYSPYDNIKKQNYPVILATAGINDSQVSYWEPAKWVAKLRDYTQSQNPVLFRVNLDAGHGGASGRYESMKEDAKDLAFLVYYLTN